MKKVIDRGTKDGRKEATEKIFNKRGKGGFAQKAYTESEAAGELY